MAIITEFHSDYYGIYDPGIAGFPRTCLHSLLDLISATPSLPTPNPASTTLPAELIQLHRDAALAWQLLHRLAANTRTSMPLLRFLRGNHDFLAHHMHELVTQADSQAALVEARNQSSWPTGVANMIDSTQLNHGHQPYTNQGGLK
ncbi:unnamed protein product [Protopolystoma xenopodis]|uniref:Uncharacterized protein n=1 Tax=Protopolystoma xenopodis TaxID=117903 RepID=A0A3S5C070_9PLAT|nr:unnamed protein product [Protopolystoma xenopodis]